MYKVAVMGDYDSIYGFAALGLDTFPVSDTETAEKTLNKLASGEYAVIYVTENTAFPLRSTIARYRDEIMPAIIQIPGISGNTGEGIRRVKKSVEQAVGSDILFSEHK